MTVSYTPTLNVPPPGTTGGLWLQPLSAWLTPFLGGVALRADLRLPAVRLAESEGFGAWPTDACPFNVASLVAAPHRGRARRVKWDKVGW